MSTPKKSHSTLHVCWALVAVGAFGAGYFGRSASGLQSVSTDSYQGQVGTVATAHTGKRGASAPDATVGSSADLPGVSPVDESSTGRIVGKVGQVWRMG